VLLVMCFWYVASVDGREEECGKRRFVVVEQLGSCRCLATSGDDSSNRKWMDRGSVLVALLLSDFLSRTTLDCNGHESLDELIAHAVLIIFTPIASLRYRNNISTAYELRSFSLTDYS
jgi:hypothetical protein